MSKTQNTGLHERVAKLESRDVSQSDKINEIHKALMGNGQPGLLAEWNQWKGGVKFFGIAFGIALSILSIAVGVLALV